MQKRPSKIPGFILPLLFIPMISFFSCEEQLAPVSIPDDYGTWKLSTDLVLDYPVPAKAGPIRKIFINKIGLEASVKTVEGEPQLDYPVGTVLVKEVYENQETYELSEPFALLAMEKAPDDPRNRGGWLWEMKGPDGITVAVESDFCITCHNSANQRHPYNDDYESILFRDYVFFTAEEILERIRNN